jgi:hypothetical protein
MSEEIRNYVQLRERMHEALAAQHPEWIEAGGESPMLALYDARFAELLARFDSAAEQAVA